MTLPCIIVCAWSTTRENLLTSNKTDKVQKLLRATRTMRERTRKGDEREDDEEKGTTERNDEKEMHRKMVWYLCWWNKR